MSSPTETVASLLATLTPLGVFIGVSLIIRPKARLPFRRAAIAVNP